jgi:hypothetical protein
VRGIRKPRRDLKPPRIPPEEIAAAQARPVFEGWEDYLAAYPAAEHHLGWLSGRENLVFLPGYPGWDCLLEGGYYWARVMHYSDGSWGVYIGSGDDSDGMIPAADEAEAQTILEDLKALAPFHLMELKLFFEVRG